MSYKTEREDFIVRFAIETMQRDPAMRALHAADEARTILKYARFLQRDAVALCNGTYPYYHGETGQCTECENVVQVLTLKRCKAIGGGVYCPSCRQAVRLVNLARHYGYQVLTSGDPRGYVVKLFPVGTTPEQMHQGIGAWGVPA